MAGEDEFELHRALADVAPAAVRALIDICRADYVDDEARAESLARLRQMQEAGLFDELPIDLRREADELLGDAS